MEFLIELKPVLKSELENVLGLAAGTGGGSVALLLKPSDKADRTGRCGGGTRALFVSTAVADRLGSAGTGLSGERSAAAVGCLGGSDGREGRARVVSAVALKQSPRDAHLGQRA